MPRPDVAPRPVCRYHNITPRGCLAGDNCHYLHEDPSVAKYTPYEENKTCRFYAQGYCKRGKECWYKHVDPSEATTAASANSSGSASKNLVGGPPAVKDDVPFCGICLEEKPAVYGLLSRCSHAFCLTCIRQWRDPKGKTVEMAATGIHKTCPVCRMPTKYIVPSSRFYMQNDPRKADVVEKYRKSMARVPCRYFGRSKPEKRFCPFGRDCFYQHANPDGTSYEFAHGVDTMMHGRNVEEGFPTTEQVLELLQGFLQQL